MKRVESPLTLGLAFACAAITFSLAVSARAQTFTSLGYFNVSNGWQPLGSVIQATNGDFYGTTTVGGVNGGGVVFQMTPAGKLSDIYSFCAQTNCADGQYPTSGPILGSDGDFYGVTYNGGNNTNSGTFYKMTIGGKITTLYTFCPVSPCSDGQNPNGVIQASNGNFYGTTYTSGKFNSGTLFEISSSGTFKLLYTFCSRQSCVDGATPYVPPMQAPNGNFYGITNNGGTQGDGVVYEITPTGTYKVLYNFCSQADCADGESPNQIVPDSSGNLYGTTSYGGAYGDGTVFEITSTNEYVVLHSFDGNDGETPNAGLILASDGNLYGVAPNGTSRGNGTIFEITTAGVFTQLYTFCSSCADDNSYYALFQGTDGSFYGTTQYGGADGDGNVFSFSNGLSPLVETVPIAGKTAARVIILGNGLTGSTSVTFNGAEATFTVVSDTEITATVPTGATSGTVTVVTLSGPLNSNPPFVVTK